jgi:hypothetical protein
MKDSHSICKSSSGLPNVSKLLRRRNPHQMFHLLFNRNLNLYKESRGSSVGTALGYGPDNRGSRVRFPAETGNFSLHHRVQNGSGLLSLISNW